MLDWHYLTAENTRGFSGFRHEEKAVMLNWPYLTTENTRDLVGSTMKRRQ